MGKLKLLTVIGTRPEIIKLSEVIKKCNRYFDHIVAHTGQNYDYALKDAFFDDLGLASPHFFLDVAGGHVGQMIGNIIERSYDLMVREKPDALLTLGDTNSAISALSAKRLKIPVFHMEAGNRCFDENLPEEINRRIVDHIADVNLPYTEHARRYLFAEGIRKEYIFVTGSPMSEIIKANMDKIMASGIVETLGLETGKYILLSAHREENIDIEENFTSLMDAVNAMAAEYGIPVVYSVHPRSAKYIEKRNFRFHENVRRLQPFCFSDYVKLQKSALCVVSDSGTLAEESSILNFPAVSIRTSTERPEALDKGGFVIGGIRAGQVLQSMETAIAMHKDEDYGASVPDYADLNVSEKIVKLIQSYTGIINNRVWGK